MTLVVYTGYPQIDDNDKRRSCVDSCVKVRGGQALPRLSSPKGPLLRLGQRRWEVHKPLRRARVGERGSVPSGLQLI